MFIQTKENILDTIQTVLHVLYPNIIIEVWGVEDKNDSIVNKAAPINLTYINRILAVHLCDLMSSKLPDISNQPSLRLVEYIY